MTFVLIAMLATSILLLGFAAGVATATWENREIVDPTAPCECGHRREDHIYHEGACRPGFVCAQGCDEFRPVGARR